MSAGLAEILLYNLRIGTTVFGGVGPQLSAMRRDLVEDRRWVTPADFERGVALAYLCPGPVGPQTACYLAWRRAGAAGSVAALLGFTLPSFALVCLLAWAAERWGLGGGFGRFVAGMRCAVAPVVGLAAARLFSKLPGKVEKALSAAGALWCLARPADATLVVFAAGLLLAGRAGAAGRRGAVEPSLLAVFLVGLQAGALVYGTGNAILPLVREAAVVRRGWITDSQFADAVSAGLVTPGPIVMAVAYVGWLARGLSGAAAAAAGAFLPGWALVLLVGPWMERLEKRPSLAAFARGATAGAIGGVAAAAASLAVATLSSPGAAALALAALGGLLWGRVPDAVIILACGAVGAISP